MTSITAVRLHSGDHSTYALQITGHADYGPAGADIVCAGVSAITYALAEFLVESTERVTLTQLVLNPGDVRIACTGSADDAFKMACLGYALLQQQYPENIFLEINDAGNAICSNV